MSENLFIESLQERVRANSTHLCIGIDPDITKIPSFLHGNEMSNSQIVTDFIEIVVEETHSNCLGYKPNLAFFEALGYSGWEVYHRCLDIIPADKLIIADAKRGDIGNTAAQYAKAFLGDNRVDALTVNPLMGLDTLEPMLQYPDKAIYVLTLTSNMGASKTLEKPFEGFNSMAEYFANQFATLQERSETHIGMVVGATKISDAEKLLAQFPESSLLMPGVGAQGAKPSDVQSLFTSAQSPPIIPISRAITYPEARNLVEFREQLRIHSKQYSQELSPLRLSHA